MTASFEHDVVVVGGGLAGPAAGVFLARADLDTLLFDRGASSIQQCAHLGNYLGFPAGIDVETFLDLAHAHVREVGGTVRPETVTAISRAGAGFRVQTDRSVVTARRVVAATKCDGSYLDSLSEELPTATDAPGGSDLDPEAVDEDGRTPVDGLYVAGPLGGAPDQAIVAAGHGARVARALIRDRLRDRGYWEEAAACYFDWRTPEAAHEADWDEEFAAWLQETAPADADPDRVERVVREVVARERCHSLSTDEAERRAERAQHAILDQLDDDVIRSYLAQGATNRR